MLAPHELWSLPTRHIGRRTLVFDHLDSTNALALELTRLVDAAEVRHTMGARAREHCLAHYAIETVATGWEPVLEEARRVSR